MQDQIKKLEPRLLKMARDIGRLARDAGFRSFVAGGCVRDLVLGRKVKDLDVLIDGDALCVARLFSSRCQGQLVVYKQFGTATVSLKDGRVVDFTTLRCERYPYPGALPIVSSGTLQQDLFRRDFTINAMVISIHPSDFGLLIDHYGGLDDLKRKVIRILHDQSFVDDPTRILRAVRFEQRFGFTIEPVTLKLLRGALRADVFKSVKPPRLFEEFKKNLKEGAVILNLKRLCALGALRFLDGGIALDKERERLIKDVLGALNWAGKNLDDLTLESSWLVLWMVLCDGMSVQKCKVMMDRFAFRAIDKDKTLNALSAVAVIKELARDKMTASDVYMKLRFKSVEELIYFSSRSTVPLTRERVRTYLLKGRHVTLKINGDDLNRSGIPSGKVFKEILDGVLKRVVDGQLQRKAQQLAYARELYQQNKS